MPFAEFLLGCISRPPVRPKLEPDTSRLVVAWGDRPLDMSHISLFGPRAGLPEENPPGFWASVAEAIGHRIGIPDEAKLGTNLLVL